MLPETKRPGYTRIPPEHQHQDRKGNHRVPYLKNYPGIYGRVRIDAETYEVAGNGSLDHVLAWCQERGGGVIGAAINKSAWIDGTWQPLLFYVWLQPVTDETDHPCPHGNAHTKHDLAERLCPVCVGVIGCCCHEDEPQEDET